ncbi:SDR family NAD(P)-dependent oxidoreductase [Marivirga sp. S37H4]|uniref:SDR family NAD(P)-dependent oxidoreductase n=1 Tax=Marivirga aurantiaca TaxID=2802615 RepID=A0A934X1K3_9BACT|nr:SDR family NAD(P)-dependent oxidoreductase [Marivirga aurantiaca]MBK6266630.1 SDR family NAD(P)-dependent oxidoreductase [Marivirga aurantiaca]
MNKISILGCGWLGLPLAEAFVKDGFIVKGSSTSNSKTDLLSHKKIIPYQITLPLQNYESDFFDTDFLVINIPPQTRSKGPDFHLACIQSIISFIPENLKIIYISATSVYPDRDKEITEEEPVDETSDRAKALWQVENLLRNEFGKRLTIIRMGGLLGYDRVPGKYFSGKKVNNAQQKVNYIHRDDAVGIIQQLVHRNIFGELFNAVAPLHPSRKEVFLRNAQELGFEPPIFENEPSSLLQRFINGEKIEHYLEYSFIYPDPLHFYYTI